MHMDVVEHINAVSSQRFGELDTTTRVEVMTGGGPVMATPAALIVGIAAGLYALLGGLEPRELQ
jgi:hypothetical protein